MIFSFLKDSGGFFRNSILPGFLKTKVVFCGIFFFSSLFNLHGKETQNQIDPFHHFMLIKTYQQEFDWLNPWNKKDVVTRSGVASVVKTGKGKLMLLTSADLVANATLIEARRKNASLPSRMHLNRIDHALNLALLESSEKSFFEGLKALEWEIAEKGEAELPVLNPGQKKPFQGEITRLTVGHRQVRDTWLPILQLSLKEIPPQGSIVIQKQKAVGMVLNGSQGNHNVLPLQLVKGFLTNGTGIEQTGLAHRGFQWKSFSQPSLAGFAKIPENLEGVWVSRVLPYGTGSEVLNVGDYLTHIGKWELSREGQIEHSKWGNVLFDALFLEDLEPGQEVELSLYRKGKRLKLTTKVGIYQENGNRVPMKIFEKPPRYLIRGGLVFQELTVNYLEVWGQNWQNRAPLRLRLFKQLDRSRIEKFSKLKNLKNQDQERIVILSQVLPDAVNIGYQELRNLVVKRANGRKVIHLESLVEALKQPQTGLHRIEFLPGSERVQVVLPVVELAKADARIKNNFQIPRFQSL
ncbi:MAG: hypothetical protein QF537_18380 [SAR324 cluster bacterium]|jgi:hypothetical protein|nr:hypothetical protein [Deltaproteobacteria bacterium]MBP44820.1 hypothetical protein [Deltaproteobacteria bacterium]MDP6093914.1 hypothetical protein [SAR324 cluster bacterium]|tara:strand:- start:463 stop:2028 length:1566 start_codon:yes stop_codon:yes gene_type:complete